jgi:hypothetical protein
VILENQPHPSPIDRCANHVYIREREFTEPSTHAIWESRSGYSFSGSLPLVDVGVNVVGKFLDLMLRKSHVLADVVHCREPTAFQQFTDALREMF